MLPSVTSDQLQILLDNVDNLRDRAIISLLFDSGLRVSEICNINPQEVDFGSNTLRVIVKGNKEAKAAFTHGTAKLLMEYTSGNASEGILFNIKARGVQDMLARLSEKVGFPCNAHAFRRGFACNLLGFGVMGYLVYRWSIR